MSKLTGYDLSRDWFDFCYENPEKITPTHTALYFFAIEHCNRLGWKPKFGLPTEMTKEAIGVKSTHTYIKVFNDIVSFGFFKLIEKSKNQYSSNIIALSKNDKALYKALDKAQAKHYTKHEQSTIQSNDTINKLLNIELLNIELINNNIDLISKNLEKWILQELKEKTKYPTLEEMTAYFLENGFDSKLAKKVFNYYVTGNWKDVSGKKVLNWKQKVQSVWFKDENRPSEQPQEQKTDPTQPVGTNKKPFTKLRRKDFKSNSEFLGACHKRQENPDPFDFSFPKDLTKDKTDEQIEYMEAKLMRDNPNGLRIEL